MDGQKIISEIEKVVRHCGERMLTADRASFDVEGKTGNGNFVTHYDKLNQEELQTELLKIVPEAVFVGEEEDVHAAIDKGLSFIVDPIDGTMNFIRDLKASVVSVGLLEDGVPMIGVIYNPYRDELFTAERGKGAFLNGKPIHVSNRPIRESIVLYGSASYYPELFEKTHRMLTEFSRRVFDIRRSGSVALDLCDLAAGRGEIVFECRLCPWDYAGAAVIVEEAGGRISKFDGSPLDFGAPCEVFARGAGIHDSDLPL